MIFAGQIATNKSAARIIINILIIILIGISRVYLGVHYVGDILVGTVAGIVVALLVFWLYKTLTKNSYKYSHRESELYTSSGYLRKDIAVFLVVLYSTYLLILFIALIMQGVMPM